MPTLVQLQDEPYWGAEREPPALDWLADQLCARYNRPRFAAGIKGDEHHLRGSHRSRRWILRSAWCTSRTYTVTHADDLAGDEDWCAGLDFNPGNVERLIAICQRLDRAARAGRIEEVSEWYGNVNGDAVVDGWDNVRNLARGSDSSHLWHLHLTVKRRYANDAAVMQRLYEILTGDEMAAADDVIMSGKALDANGNPLSDTVSGGIVRVWLRRTLGHVPGPETSGDVDRRSILDMVRALMDRPAVQPAPVDVAALAAALRPHLEAASEAAVRKVLGAVDE